MKMFIQIIIDPENGQPATTKNVAEFKRESLSTDTLGLTLLESKVILKNIQSVVAQQQVDHYIHEHQPCPRCHQHQTIKGHHIIVYRTLFGKLSLKSPGLTICSCQNSDQKSISPLSKVLPERMSPEFQFLQSKWASLVSYGMALNIIEDVLPVKSNIATVFNNTQKVAQRLDAEIGDEKISYIGGVSPNPINFRHSFPPTIVFIPIETIAFILNAHVFDYAVT